MKRTKLHLAPNLSFTTDVITEVIDLIAKRGSGKTYTATKLAEEMLSVGAQIVVIDPVGNWYGLRLGSGGKAEGGLDITILGGRHGDIPLEYTGGALVAKTIVETGMSAILDVSMLSKVKQRRFITDFAASLLELRKRDPAAMHVFWEEAYRFMPQKLSKGSKNEMLEATEELVTMGRNFGIGGTIICQRSAQISKTVLTQASILLAMNTTGPGDRKVIESWVDYHDLKMEPMELSRLKKGEAYVWWPEEFGIKKIKVAKKKTYDASSTPRFGEKKRRRKLKAIDLGALEVAMAETIEKAKGEDPRLLKRRIAELEKRGVERTIDRERLAKAKPAITEKDIRRFEKAIDKGRDAIALLVGEIAEIDQKIGALKNGKPMPVHYVIPSMKAANPPVYQNSGGAVRLKDYIRDDRPAQLHIIAAGALRMLKVLAAISPGGLTRKQVATAARMKSRGGTFGTYWSKLNTNQFIRTDGQRWFITDDGMTHLGDDVPSQPDSPEEKVDFWCERLNGKAKELLRYLFANPHEFFTKEELGEAVGLEPRGGSFGTYLSALVSNNLAVRGNGQYSISPDLLV